MASVVVVEDEAAVVAVLVVAVLKAEVDPQGAALSSASCATNQVILVLTAGIGSTKTSNPLLHLHLLMHISQPHIPLPWPLILHRIPQPLTLHLSEFLVQHHLCFHIPPQ